MCLLQSCCLQQVTQAAAVLDPSPPAAPPLCCSARGLRDPSPPAALPLCCSARVEKKKETITESAGKQQKKKIERQEEKLKNNNRDLSMVRMKSMFAIGFCFTALMGMFNSIFDGRVVAKLPFAPLSYIQGLSHRNLLGDDYTDCSFIFLYILCTMSIRQNIQKMLGLAPSRAATKQAGGFLGPPPQAAKFS
ncbi:UNVERIFIED_CONTAM: hypothetical protein FKN15_038088 [Acipenser sinensis]